MTLQKEIKKVISNYNKKFPDDKIKSLEDKKVLWGWISSYQTLSEDFIRKFKDEVYWEWISSLHILSEYFIREFQNKVDWFYISEA